MSTYNVVTFATNRLDLSAIRSIQSNLLKLIILIVLFSVFKPNVWYLGTASIICTIFIFITNINYRRKLLPNLKVKYKYFDFKIIKELLSSGIWSVITKLGQILSDGLDLLISNVLISASSMGILAIAKTIPNAIMSLLITISSVFYPQITIYYAQNDMQKLVNEVKKSMKMSGVFTGISMSVLIVLGYDFYSLWVPNESINKIQILSIITAAGIIVQGSINPLYGLFTIVNKLRINSYVILSQGIINTIVVLILLKTTNLGIFAVAGVSSLTSMIRDLIYAPIYAAKCLNISKLTFYDIIMKYVIFTSVLILSNFLLCSFIDKSSWIGLILSGIVCVIVSIIYVYIILLDEDEQLFIKNKIRLILTRKKIKLHELETNDKETL